jgi:uncharacterized protein DUF2867
MTHHVSATIRSEEAHRFVDRRTTLILAAPETVFATIERIGGENGWPFADPLWQLRGWLDMIVGGVGMRGRASHPERLAEAEHLDFWVVERVARPTVLRLRAEMRVPGHAWLEFRVDAEDGAARLTQTAMFDPSGLGGYLYWYGLYPIHVVIFRGMVRQLAMTAMRNAAKAVRPTGS